jgi:hypothetical protein
MKIKAAPAFLNAALLGTVAAVALPAHAQTTAIEPVANTANNTVATAGQTATNVAGQLPGTVSSVGNTAGNVVGGLQPTLQPVGQGVGSALNNLTQPDNVSALLEFLSSIVPNHIEAHVNLDALRVEKLTVDVRGVDLRNLKVDLLVANSRNAGVVKSALPNATNAANGTGTSSGVNLGIGANPNVYPNNASSSTATPYSAPVEQTINR